MPTLRAPMTKELERLTGLGAGDLRPNQLEQQSGMAFRKMPLRGTRAQPLGPLAGGRSGASVGLIARLGSLCA